MTDAARMAGRICLVTGASAGIGRATALALAGRGATVVLLCRDREKGERAVRDIRRATGNPAVDLLVADLASQRQVRGAAAEFIGRFDRLDVLVNNAGTMLPRRTVGPDGMEMTLAVNHLAPFLLSNLLLDRLAASDGGRIVNVNSDAHETGRIDFDDLQMVRDYGGGVGMRAYANAKLANLLTTYELARRVQQTAVTVNAVHPGYVATDIVSFDGATGPWKLLRPFWGLMMRAILTPEQGAVPSVHLSCSPALHGVTGRYFEKCVAARSSPASYDRNLQRRMWDVSEQLTVESVNADG